MISYLRDFKNNIDILNTKSSNDRIPRLNDNQNENNISCNCDNSSM